MAAFSTQKFNLIIAPRTIFLCAVLKKRKKKKIGGMFASIPAGIYKFA